MLQRKWAVWPILAACLTASACNLLCRRDDSGLCRISKCDRTPTVRALAADIDRVEWLLECDGSIAPKTPDIWGEARLTKHRREFEDQMAAQLGTFSDSLQGFIARSDQSYVAESLAIMSAATGTSGQTSPSVLTVAQNAVPTIAPQPASATPAAGNPQAASTNVYQSQPFALMGGQTFIKPGTTLSLEPVISLDQRATFLNHLHDLRRINAGDDTGDSPGYSLNLIRVPVSIMPGKRTRIGHGAEISLTITPEYGDELLPTTFRNLVMNDVKDLLGGPIFELVDAYNKLDKQDKANPSNLRPTPPAAPAIALVQPLTKLSLAPTKRKYCITALQKAQLPTPIQNSLMASDATNMYTVDTATANQQMIGAVVQNASSSVSRHNRMPLSPTQIQPVIGDDVINQLVDAVYPPNNTHDHLMLDVFKFLGAELEAAYDLTSQPHVVETWWNTDKPFLLAKAIASNDLNTLVAYRNEFLNVVRRPQISMATEGLAWVIAVESALLNERLNDDIKEITTARKCACAPAARLPFYGPMPSPDARKAFEEYVKCRWPIHVFALDPVTEDENLGDLYSSRREMQLALSLAFTGGSINTSSFTRMSRRLETDMSTIALHRTAAGFSHGDNHFGWRFYPRFQTPDFEGNLKVLVRDEIIGGPSRDSQLKQMRIEPGQRECVAMVVMPSIVANITINTRSTWFKLTNPRHMEPSALETVELSEALKRMQTCAANVQDSCRYRDGEVDRLLTRVEQLSSELAMQTLHQQVPIENTLGGYAMFNSGQTDLAPQLQGYYGEPVVPGKENVIFLVGDHFSVHETQVLAGNRNCNFQILSRRVLQVTMPGDVNLLSNNTDKMIDVHVATPYGVTGHVHVAVAAGTQLPKSTFTWGNSPYAVQYTTTTTTATPPVTTVNLPTILPLTGEMDIDTPDNLVIPTKASLKLTVLDKAGNVIATAGDDTTTLLAYENSTKRLVLRLDAFKAMNTALQLQIQTYIQSVSIGTPLTLQLKGQMTFNGGANNASIQNVDDGVTVTVTKKP